MFPIFLHAVIAAALSLSSDGSQVATAPPAPEPAPGSSGIAAAPPAAPPAAAPAPDAAPAGAAGHMPWFREDFGPGLASVGTCAKLVETAPNGEQVAACVAVFCDAGRGQGRVQLRLGSLRFDTAVTGRLAVDGQEIAAVEFQTRPQMPSFPLAYPDSATLAVLLDAMEAGQRFSVTLDGGAWQPQGVLSVPLDTLAPLMAGFRETCAPVLPAAAPAPEDDLPDTMVVPEVELEEDAPALAPAAPPQTAAPDPGTVAPPAPSGPVSKRDQSRGRAGNAPAAAAPPVAAAPAPEPAAPANPAPVIASPAPAAPPPGHQPGGPLTVAADPAAPDATPQMTPSRFMTLEAAALTDGTGQQLAEVLMAALLPEVAAQLGVAPEVRGDLVLLDSGRLILIGHFCRPGTKGTAGCARAFMTTEGGGAPFAGATRAINDTGQIWIDLQKGNAGFPDLWVMGANGAAQKLPFLPGQGY